MATDKEMLPEVLETDPRTPTQTLFGDVSVSASVPGDAGESGNDGTVLLVGEPPTPDVSPYAEPVVPAPPSVEVEADLPARPIGRGQVWEAIDGMMGHVRRLARDLHEIEARAGEGGQLDEALRVRDEQVAAGDARSLRYIESARTDFAAVIGELRSMLFGKAGRLELDNVSGALGEVTARVAFTTTEIATLGATLQDSKTRSAGFDTLIVRVREAERTVQEIKGEVDALHGVCAEARATAAGAQASYSALRAEVQDFRERMERVERVASEIPSVRVLQQQVANLEAWRIRMVEDLAELATAAGRHELAAELTGKPRKR